MRDELDLEKLSRNGNPYSGDGIFSQPDNPSPDRNGILFCGVLRFASPAPKKIQWIAGNSSWKKESILFSRNISLQNSNIGLFYKKHPRMQEVYLFCV